MMATQFSFKDNSEVFLKATRASMDDAAAQLETDLEEAVQEKILYGYHDPHGPDRHTEIVDTGHLFDHIKAEVQRQSQNLVTVSVGAVDTKYAVFVHNGTTKLKARPFITDTLNEQRRHIRDVLEGKLRNA